MKWSTPVETGSGWRFVFTRDIGPPEIVSVKIEDPSHNGHEHHMAIIDWQLFVACCQDFECQRELGFPDARNPQLSERP